jgi:2-aminoadipate transaminase
MYTKQACDLQTGIYPQTLAFEILKNMGFDQHLQRIRDYYKRQCEVMLTAMREHFPPTVKYNEPEGGMFVWCELPEMFSATDIFPQALAQKVAYVPGSAFFANGKGHNTLRLSFSLATEDQTREGIKILGELFARVMKEN